MTLERTVDILSKIETQKSTNRISFYEPYQYQKEFHDAKDFNDNFAQQRLLMAANKVGKTFCGACEVALHLLGEYPDWWKGHRFDRPVKVWCAGMTTANTRDIIQAELLGEPGDPEDWGKGIIPKNRIVKTERQPGIPNSLSMVIVKHVSGRNSRLWFKSYEQGKEQWMGKAVDIVWLDEEPPQDIYSQGLRATLKTRGLIYMTFTPEKGMTNVVAQFMNDLKPGQQLYHATWDDAPHLGENAKNEILAALPPHERQMRSKGIPVLGSGLVFPVDEDSIKVPSFPLPKFWPKICAIDFGWDHPFVCVWVSWDRESDTAYIYDLYTVRSETPVIHAHAIKTKGEKIPCVWPHDGMQHDKGSGEPLSKFYRKLGVNMLGSHFTNPDGGNSVEPGIMDMLQRMQSGRLKVFDHLGDWFAEMRMYHRKDGKIVKERDDIMSATRYAVMSLRYASVGVEKKRIDCAFGTKDYEHEFYGNPDNRLETFKPISAIR
jgi:phage terminase large subunit-like protein